MPNCLHCAATFKDRKRLRKHLNKHHRDAHALTEVEETDIETASKKHVVPSTIIDIEVLAGWPAESSPPSGFAPSDLPLLKVRYQRKKGPDRVL
jgi:predicted small metal-binding protein